MRDVKLQSILSCSKGRSWHLGGFSGHSFSKELRLISSFHHLGNDMAIKAYTIKCQNYHKKPSTKRRSKLPQVVPWHKLTQEMPLTSSNRGGVFFEVTKVDNGILLDWNSQVLLYKSNWGLGLGNAIGWSALAEQTFSRDLSMGQIHVRTCVHLHMLDERSGQLLAKWIVYRDDYLKQLFLSSSLLQLQRIKSQEDSIL